MRTQTKLIAPREVEPRAEHPHRCTAGHRWQHGGPAASTCVIPSYDPVSGDLPFVGPEDCPLCCSRTDLLVRGLHSHYCNICDGDWRHDGHCLDSLAACCPWCFPKLDAEPVPGARSGPHFHVCPGCGQNWRHASGCSAPLRAVLPECPGCRSASATAHSEVTAPAPPPAAASGGRTALNRRARSLARAIAVLVLLSIPVAVKGYWMARSPGTEGSAPAFEERIETPSPAPLRSAPVAPPALAPPAPVLDLPKPPATSPAKHVSSSGVTSLPSAPSPAPKASSALKSSPAPESSPAPRKQAGQAPVRDRVSEPQAQESPAPPSKPAPPSSARSEVVTEAPPGVPEIPRTPSESAPPAAPVQAALPSIPGAPPIAGLGGSSGLDTSFDGHPRRANR